MLSKQGIFNCDEITIGLLPGLPQICCTPNIYTSNACVLMINNWRVCAARVTVVVLCVCLCVLLGVKFCVFVSVFSILPSWAFRCPRRGISSYTVKNAVKLKSRFLYNCLIQKLEAL